MLTVTANMLKKQGVSVLEDVPETLVTVRGEPRYVILNIDAYEKLREYELTAALCEAKNDIENGDYVVESPAEHVKRVVKE